MRLIHDVPLGTWARSILALPALYRLAIAVFGDKSNRQWFVDRVLNARDGDKLVDVGCGPAEIVRRLPRVDYIGCDVNEAYLAAARREHGTRATFIAGRCEDWLNDPRTHGADIVLAHGALHHVDDNELQRIFEFAHTVLKPGGRFIFYEPCFLLWQSRSAAFFMSHDRGQFIRTEGEWKRQAARVFNRFTTSIVTHVNRLGYTCIIAECYKE